MEILDSFPDFGTLLLCALPLLYLFGVPLLILATFHTEAFPTIEPVPPHDPLPETVREQFFSIHDSLTPLGFANVGTFLLPQAVSNVKGLIAIFTNRDECTDAMSAVLYGNVNGEWKLQEKYTEFSTGFDDASEINTSNQKTLGAFPIPKQKFSTMHPTIQNVNTLFAAHQAMRRHHASRGRPVHRLDEQFRGDVAAYISSGMTAEFEHAKEAGYLRYQGGDKTGFSSAMRNSPYHPPAEISKPRYVPTLVGAYLMTWKQLWPFKMFCSWSRHRHDRQLLQATGFEWGERAG